MTRAAVRALSVLACLPILGYPGACAGPGSGPLAFERPPAPSTPRTPPDSALRHHEQPAEPVTLPTLDDQAGIEDYLEYAALNNPGLEAAFERWRSALERVHQAGVLPDPRFTYSYYVAEVETRVGPIQHQAAISQTFPWLGTLRDREDAAARDAEAAYRRYEAARLELFERVKHAYLDLWLLSRRIEITQSNLELLQQFEQVARARYRVAETSHPDLVRVQVELGKLEDRLRALRAMRPSRVGDLNAALNRRADAPLPWPGAAPSWSVDAEQRALVDELRDRNPTLLALDEQIERERLAEALARREGLPDVTFGLGYTLVAERDGLDIPENGDDAIMATVSLNVPIWRSKYRAAVREAAARRRALAHERHDRANTLVARLQRALFEHDDARRRVALFEDTLIPKATESLQSSLAAFRTGEADFLDLLDTERTLLQFQIDAERARAEQATTYATIERLVGGALDTEAAGDPDPVGANP